MGITVISRLNEHECIHEYQYEGEPFGLVDAEYINPQTALSLFSVLCLRKRFSQPSRLSYKTPRYFSFIQVGAEYIKLIWVPDTFFVNEKIALFHQVSIAPLN